MATQHTNISTSKLIALWAFSESSLGGLLHAFQVPFSGFWLAAIAVTILCCIILYDPNPTKMILYGTGIAIVVKLVLSPHTPLTAYVAVGFQGLLGAVVARLPLHNSIRFPLFGGLALLESGLQKVLILTVVFGKNLWESLNTLADLLFPSLDGSFSYWAILCYSLIYFFWGMLVGYWATGLPGRISYIQQSSINWANDAGQIKNISKKWRWSLLIFPVAYLLLIYWVFRTSQTSHPWMLLLRPLIIIGFWYFFLNKFLKLILSQWVRKTQNKNIHFINSIQNELSTFRIKAGQAFTYANQHYSGFGKLKYFIPAMIYLVCIYDHAESES